MPMLPSATFNDPGNSSSGSVYGGPFTGPDTVLESNNTFLVVDATVVLGDAIAQLPDGSTPAQGHAYLVAVGSLQNVKAVLYAAQLQPSVQNRIVPKLKFNAGDIIYVRGVQLTEAATAAAEQTYLVLSFKKQ